MNGSHGDGYGAPTWQILADADLTGGDLDVVVETRMALGGPRRHVHRDRTEAFLVLDGRYRFWRGEEELELEPGGFVLVPRGTAHRFITLEAPSRTLIVVAPAGLAAFFREMAARIAAGETPAAAMAELATRFDSMPVD